MWVCIKISNNKSQIRFRIGHTLPPLFGSVCDCMYGYDLFDGFVMWWRWVLYVYALFFISCQHISEIEIFISMQMYIRAWCILLTFSPIPIFLVMVMPHSMFWSLRICELLFYFLNKKNLCNFKIIISFNDGNVRNKPDQTLTIPQIFKLLVCRVYVCVCGVFGWYVIVKIDRHSVEPE